MYTSHDRHVVVEHEHVGSELERETQRLLAVTRHADDGHVELGVENVPEVSQS